MVNQEKIVTFVKEVIHHLSSKEEVKKLFFACIDQNEANAEAFANHMEEVESRLELDASFFMESDPAADSLEEIKATYPGYLAICNYRIAHVLRELGYKLESRVISERAHSKTGIDIHPGAQIDAPFFIDHGTGIVIGETAIVGKRVKLYQGVTLGALSLAKGYLLKGTKRHPTLGDDVTVYSNASILGDIKIGDDVTIGSSVFLMDDVPSHMKVTIGKPILDMKKKD